MTLIGDADARVSFGGAPVVADEFVALPFVPDRIGRRRGETPVAVLGRRDVAQRMLGMKVFGGAIVPSAAGVVAGDAREGLLEGVGQAGHDPVGGPGPDGVGAGEDLGAGVEVVVGVEQWLGFSPPAGRRIVIRAQRAVEPRREQADREPADLFGDLGEGEVAILKADGFAEAAEGGGVEGDLFGVKR